MKNLKINVLIKEITNIILKYYFFINFKTKIITVQYSEKTYI